MRSYVLMVLKEGSYLRTGTGCRVFGSLVSLIDVMDSRGISNVWLHKNI